MNSALDDIQIIFPEELPEGIGFKVIEIKIQGEKEDNDVINYDYFHFVVVKEIRKLIKQVYFWDSRQMD